MLNGSTSAQMNSKETINRGKSKCLHGLDMINCGLKKWLRKHGILCHTQFVELTAI